MEAPDTTALENRPAIFMIGSSNVGKRTLLSRLLSVDFEDTSDSSSEVLAQGWTINTKYYTADVSVWMAHLHDEFSIKTLPVYNCLTALVMVFDVNDLSSLVALQDWVSRTDIQKFEILLCIGNKVDLISDHPVHAEYRRRLKNLEESSADTYTEFYEFGISEAEGSSLLGGEDPAGDIKRSCLDWCTEHNIEYIESCASNADFDKCLSVDGDSQGVERLFGALSAHMWPGMILKSGNNIPQPALPNIEDLSEEESDYEFEYEVLSAGTAEQWDDTNEEWVSATGTSSVSDVRGSIGQNNHIIEHDHVLSAGTAEQWDDTNEEWVSATGTSSVSDVRGSIGQNNHIIEHDHVLSAGTAEQWDDTNEEWVSATGTSSVSDVRGSIGQNNHIIEHDHANWEKFDNKEQQPSTSIVELQNKEVLLNVDDRNVEAETNEVTPFEFEDLEQLMSEIGNIRDNLRFMPDFQRREMAAKLAMKMATMFGGGSDDEEALD
ncbi:uncharacterized protein LOC105628588 isoform X3 [Jatropha curcas]|uniref:uncharacterized protein LOC105628588 isoform X2 n=1 Tax=Jatropha curcas TaxID=180498 RepID=UPI0018943040|nr:uncharacterized protein LOC105628588 isoform X2 [Jatropha curcas]XP_037495197.1 uncharacterized protein LOC105628588 isoform X3 [Jatropha curcas]